jgi:hypothetical protein
MTRGLAGTAGGKKNNRMSFKLFIPDRCRLRNNISSFHSRWVGCRVQAVTVNLVPLNWASREIRDRNFECISLNIRDRTWRNQIIMFNPTCEISRFGHSFHGVISSSDYSLRDSAWTQVTGVQKKRSTIHYERSLLDGTVPELLLASIPKNTLISIHAFPYDFGLSKGR